MPLAPRTDQALTARHSRDLLVKVLKREGDLVPRRRRLREGALGLVGTRQWVAKVAEEHDLGGSAPLILNGHRVLRLAVGILMEHHELVRGELVFLGSADEVLAVLGIL
jgi:hypothetical protein